VIEWWHDTIAYGYDAFAMLHFNDLLGTQPTAKRRNKFNAVRTVVDGLKFDSKREAARWAELRTMERAGVITALERQVKFPMVVNGILVCSYVADFRYCEGGRAVVEDVKSEITRKEPTYRIKVKLMQAVHGIEVREVT
jgi:hypothetical protein